MAKKEVPLGRRNQITIPKEYIPEGVKFFVCEKNEDGTILLTPEITVPVTQAYFWTPRWQEGERKASEDIQAGRVTPIGSVKEFIASAKRKKKRKA